MIESHNWALLDEGGQHVVCQFRPEDEDISSVYSDSVLRIRKPRDVGQVPDLDFIESYEACVNGVLYPSSSSLRSSKIILDSSFLKELSRIIQRSRPIRFQSSPLDGLLIGEVMPNALKLYKKPHNAGASLCGELSSIISLEIKVKGGLPSVSPFVAGAASIKRQYGRHHLKQLACLGDSTEFEEAVSHHPIDLGSRHYDTIRLSLSDLVKRPKKVLRCYVDGGLALGGFSASGMPGQDACEREEEWSVLCEKTLPGVPEAGEMVLSAVASVLAHEDTAHCLLNVQKFDLIDIEGAGAIYDHLLSLLGSKDAVDASLLQGMLDMASLLKLLAQYFEACSVQVQNKKNVDHIKSALPQVIQRLLSMCEDLPQPSHANMLAFCAELSEQEGTTLLNLWLIALAAKDASLIVSLQCAHRKVSSPSPVGGAIEVKEHVKQTDERCGLTVLACSGSARAEVSYTLALVDIGYKDPAKCWNKRSKEEEFCERATKAAKPKQEVDIRTYRKED